MRHACIGQRAQLPSTCNIVRQQGCDCRGNRAPLWGAVAPGSCPSLRLPQQHTPLTWSMGVMACSAVLLAMSSAPWITCQARGMPLGAQIRWLMCSSGCTVAPVQRRQCSGASAVAPAECSAQQASPANRACGALAWHPLHHLHFVQAERHLPHLPLMSLAVQPHKGLELVPPAGAEHRAVRAQWLAVQPPTMQPNAQCRPHGCCMRTAAFCTGLQRQQRVLAINCKQAKEAPPEQR